MPFVDPQTIHNPATGTIATAAWGDSVRDATVYLANPPKTRVFNSAAISVANSTTTVLTFNSERFDTDTMHSTTVNTSRITFTTAGTYLVGLNLSYAASATGYRDAKIQLDGTTIIASQRTNASGSGTTPIAVSGLYAFTAGQYVEALAEHNSGAALNVEAAGNVSPEFFAVWVSL